MGEGASNAASSAFAGGEKCGTDGIASMFVAEGGTTDGGGRVVATGTGAGESVVEVSASTTAEIAAMEGNRSGHQCFGSEGMTTSSGGQWEDKENIVDFKKM